MVVHAIYVQTTCEEYAPVGGNLFCTCTMCSLDDVMKIKLVVFVDFIHPYHIESNLLMHVGVYVIWKQYVRLAYHGVAGDCTVCDIESQHEC